jgi:hypothetical protein
MARATTGLIIGLTVTGNKKARVLPGPFRSGGIMVCVKVSNFMPKYRFNLEDHQFIADSGSYECADKFDAQILANEIADRLVQEQPALIEGGHAIVVRDERNRPLYRAAMDKTSIFQRRN